MTTKTFPNTNQNRLNALTALIPDLALGVFSENDLLENLQNASKIKITNATFKDKPFTALIMAHATKEMPLQFLDSSTYSIGYDNAGELKAFYFNASTQVCLSTPISIDTYNRLQSLLLAI